MAKAIVPHSPAPVGLCPTSREIRSPRAVPRHKSTISFRRWHALTAIALVTVTLSACGGGSSPPDSTPSNSSTSSSTSGSTAGTNNSALSGTYAYVTLSNNGTMGGSEPLSGVGQFGTMTFDGTGSYTGAVTINSGGTVSASQASSGTYAVTASDSVTLGTWSGNVSADGSALVMTDLTAGDPPTVAVAIKEGGSGFSNASLQGAYTMAGLNNSGSTGLGLASLSTMTFDGAGNFTDTETENNGGSISPTPVNASGTYSITASGAVTVTLSGGNALTGQISADGSRVVLADLNPADAPSLFVVIKQGAATYSNASLQGTYAGATLSTGGADGSISGALSLTFIGTGTFSGTATQSNGTAISDATEISGSYSVAAAGSMSLTPGTSNPMTGQISADGNTVVLEDLSAGDPPSMTVVVK